MKKPRLPLRPSKPKAPVKMFKQRSFLKADLILSAYDKNPCSDCGGCVSFMASIDDLEQLIQQMKKLAEEHENDPKDITVVFDESSPQIYFEEFKVNTRYDLEMRYYKSALADYKSKLESYDEKMVTYEKQLLEYNSWKAKNDLVQAQKRLVQAQKQVDNLQKRA